MAPLNIALELITTSLNPHNVREFEDLGSATTVSLFGQPSDIPIRPLVSAAKWFAGVFVVTLVFVHPAGTTGASRYIFAALLGLVYGGVTFALVAGIQLIRRWDQRRHQARRFGASNNSRQSS